VSATKGEHPARRAAQTFGALPTLSWQIWASVRRFMRADLPVLRISRPEADPL